MLQRLFKLTEHNTCLKVEAVAGLTTFMTLSCAAGDQCESVKISVQGRLGCLGGEEIPSRYRSQS